MVGLFGEEFRERYGTSRELAELHVEKDVCFGGGVSGFLRRPFDWGKRILDSLDYRVISAEENAGLRVREGASSSVSCNGNWVREGVLYVPRKGVFVTKNNPVMGCAEEATIFKEDEGKFYLRDGQVEEALVGAVEIYGKTNPVSNFSVVSLEEFGDSEAMNYLFGENVSEYGRLLCDVGKRSVSIEPEHIGDKAFVSPLYFKGIWKCIGGGFDLGHRSFADYEALRGVRDLENDL